MIDVRIPWKLGLKGHFGSMLKALGLSTPIEGLKHPTDKARAHIHSSALPLGSSACGRTVHDMSPFSPRIGNLEKEKSCFLFYSD
jgi:hypothetical protein